MILYESLLCNCLLLHLTVIYKRCSCLLFHIIRIMLRSHWYFNTFGHFRLDTSLNCRRREVYVHWRRNFGLNFGVFCGSFSCVFDSTTQYRRVLKNFLNSEILCVTSHFAWLLLQWYSWTALVYIVVLYIRTQEIVVALLVKSSSKLEHIVLIRYVYLLTFYHMSKRVPLLPMVFDKTNAFHLMLLKNRWHYNGIVFKFTRQRLCIFKHRHS